MKEIIKKCLDEIAQSCNNSVDCQLNFSADSARNMIANKVAEELDPYVDRLVEDIVVGESSSAKRLKKAFGE